MKPEVQSGRSSCVLCMAAACGCYCKGILRMHWLFLTQLFLSFKSLHQTSWLQSAMSMQGAVPLSFLFGLFCLDRLKCVSKCLGKAQD